MTIMAGVWWLEDFGMATTIIATQAMYDSWLKLLAAYKKIITDEEERTRKQEYQLTENQIKE